MRPTLCAFLLAGALLQAAPQARAAVTRGQRAPNFSLPTLKGPKVALASYRGKVVLIDFWAQWCEPCKRELPELERLARDLRSQGVVILAINIDKQRDNAERMARQLGLTLDVLLDPAGAVAATFELPKMPTSFLVDKKGVVRYVHEGFEGSGDVERFRRELAELIK